MYKHTSMLVFLLSNSGYGKFSFGLGNWEVKGGNSDINSFWTTYIVTFPGYIN